LTRKLNVLNILIRVSLQSKEFETEPSTAHFHNGFKGKLL